MPIDPPFTAWQTVKDSSMARIRLVAAADDVALYRSSTVASDDPDKAWPNVWNVTLSAEAMKGNPPSDVTIPQPLFTDPAFDVVAAGGQIVVAIEQFGGGSNTLLIGIEDDNGFDVKNQSDNLNDYRFPRFVRGSAVPPGHFVTAIVEGTFIALMTDRGSRTDSPSYMTLAPGNAGVLIADGEPPSGLANGALPATASLSLFGKSPGPPGPLSPAREPPGTLFMLRVPAGGKRGTPKALLDTNGSYSFDVDAHSGVALLVASTAKGPQMLSIDLTKGTTTLVAWPEGYPGDGGWITNPTVLAVAGSTGQKLFSFAFYEGVGDAVTGIRYGQIDLGTPASAPAA